MNDDIYWVPKGAKFDPPKDEARAPNGAGGAPPPPPPEPPEDGPLGPEPEPNDGAEIDAGALITEQRAMLAFIAAFPDDLRFNHSAKTWMVWAGHYWKLDDHRTAFAGALNLCRELAGTIQGRKEREGKLAVEKIRFAASVIDGAGAMPPFTTAQTNWDANLTLLGTPGGVVDLTTGELRDGVREDMIARVTNATPSLSPDCPTWISFLDFAMNEEGQNGAGPMVRFLQRYFGYCLTGRTNEEIFLFMFGIAGAGKGTMIETIVHIMGDYAGTLPMEVFAGKSWSPTEYYRASMSGKRLIVANEPERDAYWAEAFIKETTGGDTLSGRFPMGRVFHFKPTHKMAMSGNHMPRLRGRSTGMERRLRIAEFNRKPEVSDTSLKARMLAEAPGILRWLIEGCLAWQKRGLDPPNAVHEAGTKYFEAQDAFARWVDECCNLDPFDSLSPSLLRTNFNAWARRNGEDEMTGNAFGEAIDHYEPPHPHKPLQRVKTNGVRLVKGINVKVDNSSEDWRNK